MISFIRTNINFILYFFGFLILTWKADFAMPIETIPDEIAQLKNIYAMLESRSLTLEHPSQFSIWIHYTYLIPTVFYWLIQYINFDGSMKEFKIYVIENYQIVLPILRIYTATVFLLGLILVRKVIQNTINELQANLFFVMVILNLLIVMNSHYSKFWMIDFGLVFIALYFYMQYKLTLKKYFLVLGITVFTFGILSNYSIVMFGIYFILLHYYYDTSHKKLFADIILFFLILIFIFSLQMQLGAGGHIDMIRADPWKFFLPKLDVAIKLMYTQFDYDIIGTIMFICSVIYLIFGKNKKILFLMIPYLLNLFFISSMHYEPRYALFLIIDSAFIATFFWNYLYLERKSFFIFLLSLLILSNSFLVFKWLNILAAGDTRLEAKEWIQTNLKEKDFVIYNTLGFNYIGLHAEGIKIIQQNFPNALSTREHLHLKYELSDKTNSIILWKYKQAGYLAADLVRVLREKGFAVYLINEKFGKDSVHGHRLVDYYKDFNNNTKLKLVKNISPFKDNLNRETKKYIGDVLYNFNNTWETLQSVIKSGPEIGIYKVYRRGINGNN